MTLDIKKLVEDLDRAKTTLEAEEIIDDFYFELKSFLSKRPKNRQCRGILLMAPTVMGKNQAPMIISQLHDAPVFLIRQLYDHLEKILVE